MTELPDPLTLIVVLGALALVPFLAVMVTSFVKLMVVFSLVRNALGIQQIPPNMALNGLALILTIYIMAPVFYDVYDRLKTDPINFKDSASLITALDHAQGPFRAFLLRNTGESERAFFTRAAKDLWPPERAEAVTDQDLLILVPAFTTSELTSAFQVGFLLYLPFIAIDLIVSNILLAMGMMMVSPMTISLPFKLFLFVAVDGWQRLIHGLVQSYSIN
jgi:type III secretion protein R